MKPGAIQGRDRKSNRAGGWIGAEASIAGRGVASAARGPTVTTGISSPSEEIEQAWGGGLPCPGCRKGASTAGAGNGRGLPLPFLVEDVLG